jgi:hypothetical protein
MYTGSHTHTHTHTHRHRHTCSRPGVRAQLLQDVRVTGVYRGIRTYIHTYICIYMYIYIYADTYRADLEFARNYCRVYGL